MKIVHMIGGGDVGGAKTHVLSLVAKLSEKNDVLLISFREGEFAEDSRKMGINTLVIKNKNPLKDLKQLKKVITEGGFEVVHCHGAKANVMAAMIKGSIGIPFITTVHSDYRLDYMGNVVKKFTNGLMNTVALRALDGYVGVTDNFADMLITRGFDPCNVRVIYNGLDFDYEPKPKCSREEYLKNFGIPSDDAVVCGIAARLHPVKDIATIVRAFAKLRDICPKLYLIIAGDGEQREYLTKLVEENGLSDRIVFAGWVSDMDTFLNALDINMLSSLSESFPYSVLEAVRSECTMVVSAVGGMPVLIDHGVNGFLFKPQAVDELASHLEYLYKKPDVRCEMAKKLREKASKNYSINKMVEVQTEIYTHVIKKAKRNKIKRNRVLVCGSYGRGNAGDDAILKAVIRDIYRVDEMAQICVMSKNPKQTKLRYRVRSIYTFNVFKMFSAMRRSHLYINGGGSLIQDSTSSRSLYFYLMTLFAAKRSGCDVMMYGCGIGPVKRKKNRKMAARIIDKNVDCITLRDPDSFDELQKMGVVKPEMHLAADPTLSITPADDAIVIEALRTEGIEPDKQYLCLAMRNWNDIEKKLPHISAAASYAAEKYGLGIVLMPMERKKDIAIAERIKGSLSSEAVIIRGEYDVHTVIGMLAKMRVIMAMRLHALVFGAGQGVATIGIAYDHKVTGFMNYIGREMCVQYDECSADILNGFIDRTMNDAEYGENIQRACNTIRENEKENTRLLRGFFNDKEV